MENNIKPTNEIKVYFAYMENKRFPRKERKKYFVKHYEKRIAQERPDQNWVLSFAKYINPKEEQPKGCVMLVIGFETDQNKRKKLHRTTYIRRFRGLLGKW
jgi:hypothetical protein